MAAALSAGEPTGHAAVDAVYRAGFAAIVVLACSKGRRSTWLVLAGVALAASREWWIVPGAVALGVAFAATFQHRQRQRLGAVVGAVGVITLLHLPSFAFTGSTALLTAIATIPAIVSGYRQCSSKARTRWRRTAMGLVAAAVVCCIPAVVATVLVRHQASQGIALTRRAFDAAGNADQSQSVGLLTQAHGEFARVDDRVTAPITAIAGLVPIVSQHRDAIAKVSSLAEGLTRDAADTARAADYDQLRYHAGTIDTTKIAAMQGPLAHLTTTLEDAQKRLRGLDSPWLVAPVAHRLGSLDTEIDRALPAAQLATQAVAVVPDLLGAHGPRHYFVAFETPAEQRGLGGFIGAWGEILADNGHLKLVRSGPGSELFRKKNDPPRTLTGPAEYLARWGSFNPQDSPSDATFSPDFPAVAQVLAQLYPQSGGTHVDGVLAIDPYALAALLKFTGPIRVEGLNETLTSENVADFLVRKQYVEFPANQGERHDYLQDALQVAFDHLTSGSLPSPRAIADTLSPVARQDRLLFWSSQPAEEALARRLNIDGAMPRPDGGDLLAITTQNEAQNKIDSYLHRTVDYRAQFDPATGTVHATATVTLTNDAPAGGLPRYLIGNNFDLPDGTNATYLSLYSPLVLDSVTVAGASLPVQAGMEAGSRAYSVSVDIAPQASTTVVFQLNGTIARADTYHLVLRPQPTVNPDHVNVAVVLGPGWAVHAVRGGTTTGSDTANLSGALTERRDLTVEARRAS